MYIDFLTFINSPIAKASVRDSHHFSSVVCKLFTFQSFFDKHLDQLEPNLEGALPGVPRYDFGLILKFSMVSSINYAF
jgi:hypothetical protein